MTKGAMMPNEMTPTERVLDPSDSFCPNCGHNRNTSSVSTFDLGDGRVECQLCATTWSERRESSSGWVSVPVEPTMGQWEDFSKSVPLSFSQFYDAYKAMIAAAPPAEGK